jgi:hypothetical protein
MQDLLRWLEVRISMHVSRTVLEQKIKERRQTFEEFAEFAEVFAREHKESGTLSLRHLQRLAAGQRSNGKPLGSVRPATARLLEHIFDLDIDELLARPVDTASAGTFAVDTDHVHTDREFSWLDKHQGWSPGTTRRETASRIAAWDSNDAAGTRLVSSARTARSSIVEALLRYYSNGLTGHGAYRARCAGHELTTSILTKPEWLDLACPLSHDRDLLTLVPSSRVRTEVSTRYAIDRLAEVRLAGVRLANMPLYRLLSIDVANASIKGTVGMAQFVEYALTSDLLEGELIRSLTCPAPSMPIRDIFLPDVASVVNFEERLCAGGVLALCAIARPADSYRGPADYALLVQERSGSVVNATGQLAVIPKGFHAPLTEARAESRIGATLRREMEEELFGRADVDCTIDSPRLAAPMHPGRVSEPMGWLMEEPGRLTMECTAFGVNLVSGNYEFASLIVIDDEDFWVRYGGQIEANWEAAGLRVYSSLDSELIDELITDESWSNEGLFAFLQGIRRLAKLGGRRVNVPVVDWEVVG